VVYRIKHSDLIAHPESTMRGLLEFLEEPYETACLEPLADRINSSNVPADYKSADPDADPNVIESARQLERELMTTAPSPTPSQSAADELETAFQDRVDYLENVSGYHRRALARISQLEEEIKSLKAVCSSRTRRWSHWISRKKAWV